MARKKISKQPKKLKQPKRIEQPKTITFWGWASPNSKAWRQAENDADRFIERWGCRPVALGWDEENLIGLFWSLQGRRVVAMDSRRAWIRDRHGSTSCYRRYHAG
jgi:hypothetical protein